MENRNADVRIALTAGLLAGLCALVLLHALTLATAQRVAPHIEHAIFETAQTNAPNAPRGGINFDESRNAGGVVNTLPVNSSARDEVKRQQPNCLTCPPSPSQFPGPAVVSPSVQPVPSAKLPMVAKPTTQRYSIELFVLHNDRESETVLNWFNTDPTLQKWRKSTNFNTYTKDNRVYLTRFANKIPPSNFPVILVTDPTGGDVYVCDRSSRPATVNALTKAIADAKRIQAEVVARANQVNTPTNNGPTINSPAITDTGQSAKASLLDAIVGDFVGDCSDGKCKPKPFWRSGDSDGSDPVDHVQGFLRMIVRPGETIFQIVIILAVVVTFVYFVKRGRS